MTAEDELRHTLMGQAIGQTLSFSRGIALSPMAIIAVVLMLGTPHGRVTGLAFLGGCIVGLAVVGTMLLLASAEDASKAGAPANWVSALKMGLGVALLLLAAKQWRGRPDGEAEAELPDWMMTVGSFSPAKSAGTASLLGAVKPKKLILVLGAAAAIAETGASTASQAVALAVFVVLASIGVAVPIAIYFLAGDRAATILDELRDWLARENATIIAVICLIIGAKLIGDAIGALAA